MQPTTAPLTGFLIAVLALPAAAQSDVVTHNVMMPARDGVRLATDVYLPARDGKRLEGKFPTILIRTPYGKGGGTSFTRHGYAVVKQDVRGRGDSEGEFYIYLNEGRDGYDAVEWIAAQPWSNGMVGTYGGSYLAATQHAIAVARAPHLKAMFVTVGTSNYVRDGAGRGGAFALLHNMAYCFALARAGEEAKADETAAAALHAGYSRLPALLRSAPLGADSPLRSAPSYQKWYTDWRAHAAYDDYWKQNGYNFEEYHADYPDDVAIYLVGGWYDIFKRGTVNNFEGLAYRKAATKLVMGPWTHSVGQSFSGDVDFGGGAGFSTAGEAVRWFDRHLKRVDNGVDREPRVRYFTMGAPNAAKNGQGRLQSGGTWQTAATWPPGAREVAFHLRGDGRLTREPPSAGGSSTFDFDPRDPVPSLGGNIDSGQHLVPRGAQNQNKAARPVGGGDSAPFAERPDVLTFETRPLERALEVTGPMRMELWVSSSAVDTDFTAKLIDVYPPSEDYPDGYAMNLEDGILRMRFRDSPSTEKLMEPGEVYKITIDLWATSNVFHVGHSIRVDISSSSFPMYDVNPNTGERVGRHTKMVTANNVVYHEPSRPSRLVLPVRGT